MKEILIVLFLLFGSSSAILAGNCLHNKCENNANCLDQYEGNHAFDRFLCNSNPFALAPLYMPKCQIEGHTCICADGFDGERCENRTHELGSSSRDVCKLNPCMNDGECFINEEDIYSCKCKSGFSGEYCDIQEEPTGYCESSPCLNNGTCINRESDYTCACLHGFTGRNCSNFVDTNQYSAVYLSDLAICDINDCASKVKNGVCDQECNSFACGYDGGDCSASTKPFEKCPYAEYCSVAFANGICDEICNTENCLFDGRDCDVSPPVCPQEEYCRKARNNGVCDLQCNTTECGFDADCTAPGEQNKLNGTLEVVILSKPEDFLPKLDDFLYNMTVMLKVSANLKKDEEGPLVFKWKDDVVGQRLNVPNHKPSPTNLRANRPTGLEGVSLTLEFDAVTCKENCFKDVDSVANFIGGAIAKQDTEFEEMKIYEAKAIHSEDRPKKPDAPKSFFQYVLYVVFAIGLLLSVVGAAKRKVVTQRAVWVPPIEIAPFEAPSAKKTKKSKKETFEEHLTFYGKLETTTIEQCPVYPEWSELHVQAASANAISLPISSSSINLKAGPMGQTPLHLVVINDKKTQQQAIDDIKLLSNAAIDVNATNADGETALFLACRYQKTAIVSTLLSLAADPSIRSSSDNTCLHQAAFHADLETVEEMLKYESVRNMINEIDSTDRTPLMVAAFENTWTSEVAERLINSGAEMEHSGNQCNVAVCCGRAALHYAVESSNIQIIRFLIARGANKDATDKEGRTPVFLATKYGHFACVKVLIQLGADHGIKDNADMTPEEIAKSLGFDDIAAFLAAYPVPTPDPQATPQRPVQKSKKAPKRKQQTLTPPSSDELTTPSPLMKNQTSGMNTPSVKRTRIQTVEQNSVGDQYTPQGYQYNNMLPAKWQSPGTSMIAASSSTFTISPSEQNASVTTLNLSSTNMVNQENNMETPSLRRNSSQIAQHNSVEGDYIPQGYQYNDNVNSTIWQTPLGNFNAPSSSTYNITPPDNVLSSTIQSNLALSNGASSASTNSVAQPEPNHLAEFFYCNL